MSYDAPHSRWFEYWEPMLSYSPWVGSEGRFCSYVVKWADVPGGEQPPRGADHDGFHRSTLRTADRQEVRVGAMRLCSERAGRDMDAETARSFYDGKPVSAWVRAGEDGIGVWVAGTLAEPSLAMLPDSPGVWRLWGDWRDTDAGLTLVSVNLNIGGHWKAQYPDH
jgi:hypothetical protein